MNEKLKKIIRYDDKYDYISGENKALLISIGYMGKFPVTCEKVGVWLHENFPGTVLRKGYWLWREDFILKANKKYPEDNQYYLRRNYIIGLGLAVAKKSFDKKQKLSTKK